MDKRVNKYFKILQEPKDYYSAGKACAADGGRLAVTYGDKYLDVLRDYVKKVTNQDSMWISGERLANSSPRILFDDGEESLISLCLNIHSEYRSSLVTSNNGLSKSSS